MSKERFDVRGSTTYNYRYNKRGRLDQLTIGSTVTASYSHDGLERMAVRTTQNMTQQRQPTTSTIAPGVCWSKPRAKGPRSESMSGSTTRPA